MDSTTHTSYVTVQEAAELLGVSRKVVDRLLDEKLLIDDRKQFLRRGRHLIRRDQVEALAKK